MGRYLINKNVEHSLNVETLQATKNFHQEELKVWNPLRGHVPEIHTENDYKVVPVHKHPELILQTADLINAQWPRSQMSRLITLQASSDKMPCCLVVTKMQHKVVVGHLKITPVPSDCSLCFIESVVIAKCLRGQGIGSMLMKEAEKFCKDELNINIVYLSTTDQQGFYEKLGYKVCEPISIFGNRCFVRNLPTKKIYMKKILSS